MSWFDWRDDVCQQDEPVERKRYRKEPFNSKPKRQYQPPPESECQRLRQEQAEAARKAALKPTSK